MEWFFDILDKIIQNRIWTIVFSHLQWVDWLTVIFLIIGIIYGVKQGFFRCVAVILETLIVLWVAFTFEKKFAGILGANLTFIKEGSTRPFAYFFLLVFSGIPVMLMDGKLKSTFHTKLAGPIRNIGGIIFGAVFMMLLLSMVSKLFMLIPSTKLHKVYAEGGSKTGPVVLRIAPTVYQFMNHPFGGGDKKK